MSGIIKVFSVQGREGGTRVEICRNRHDWRSCKICASDVNFPGKQRNFSNDLCRTTRFTHTKCDFALKLFFTKSDVYKVPRF